MLSTYNILHYKINSMRTGRVPSKDMVYIPGGTCTLLPQIEKLGSNTQVLLAMLTHVVLCLFISCLYTRPNVHTKCVHSSHLLDGGQNNVPLTSVQPVLSVYGKKKKKYGINGIADSYSISQSLVNNVYVKHTCFFFFLHGSLQVMGCQAFIICIYHEPFNSFS